MKKKHQSQQDDAMAADILHLTKSESARIVEAPPRSKASKSYDSKNEKDATKKKKRKSKSTSKNNSRSKNQSVESSPLSHAKMQYASPITQGQNSNIQPSTTSSSASNTLNTSKQHRNNTGNPPYLVPQPNYQRPGAYQVNGTRRQDDSDDDSSWNNENDGNLNHETFVQEGQAQEQQHNNANQETGIHMEDRRPPANRIQTAVPMEEGTHAGKEDTDWCSYRHIFIAALIAAVVILIVTVVVIMVLIQGGGSDADPGIIPTPAPTNHNDFSPTSSPSARRSGILPYLTDNINLDDYPFLILYAFQYGFDLTGCGENGVPIIEFVCPSGKAIVMANTPIHFNQQGNVVTEIDLLSCEFTNAIEFGCSYNYQLLEEGITSLSSVFIVGCASETKDSESTTLNVYAEMISSSSCTPTPSFIMQSMSFGQFCNGNPLFSPGDYICTADGLSRDLTFPGVDNGSLHICGAFSSCHVSTTCSLDKVQVVTRPDAACIISRDDYGGSFNGLWDILGSLEQALDTSFIFPQFTQVSLAALRS